MLMTSVSHSDIIVVSYEWVDDEVPDGEGEDCEEHGECECELPVHHADAQLTSAATTMTIMMNAWKICSFTGSFIRATRLR